MKIVECWIEHPIRTLDRTFTYLTDFDVVRGMRVNVPFGNKNLVGFVESVKDTNQTKEEIEKQYNLSLKNIISVLDEDSLITDEMHDLALWMKDFTLSTTISCFQAMLPAKVKPTSSKHSIVQEVWVEINDIEVHLTPKELEAFEYAKSNIPLKYSNFRKAYPNQVKGLKDKGIISLIQKEKEASTFYNQNIQEGYTLTDLQQQAFDQIQESDDLVYLMKGVTGSGKTEVYFHLANETLKSGKQVLILVPEIALTPQMIDRVSSRFGEELAIYHSGLNAQEKYEQYRKVKTNKARIVVGTRSAIFLPFTNLGLIVMDEEHDASYKQSNQPSYHCRDVAIYRSKYNHAKLILGSATPSLDSYARAMKGVYHLIELNDRINQSMPTIHVVNMKENMKKGGSFIISEVLKEKMKERLDNHKQIILLLNRRGYNTQLRCKDCDEVIKCPHCDIAMSYHKDVKRLKCHTCGAELYVPKVCPSCNSSVGFANFGFGTERLQQEVNELFPDAKVLRMDADTTNRKNAHATILEQFGNHEADILLGTQMIAKGLDYPDVTLVGVINGDEGLSRSDFRSCEVTFDLLMQAGGRSGRALDKGEVIYQVFDSDHYAVRCAKNQDYDSFFKNEMRFRHAGEYPPYTYLIAMTFIGKNQNQVEELSIAVKNQLKGDFKVIGVIGLLKIADMYRNRIILKGKDLDEMRNAIKEFMMHTDLNIKNMHIDVNPMVLD